MKHSEHWIPVADLPLDLDHELLAMELDRYRIRYRISQQKDSSLLEVSRDEEVPTALTVLGQYRQLGKVVEQPRSSQRRQVDESLVRQIRQVPVVISLLILGVAGAFIVRFFSGLLHWFTFQDFQLSAAKGIYILPADVAFERGEYWRLLTPAFLHFGLLHLVFNSLWVWEFGRRMERLAGRTSFILIVLAITIGANLGQYLWEPNQIFGGLSGLVYGLLGYVWVRNSIAPHPLLRVPPGIVSIMLIWLLICWLGVVDLFMQGGVANGAHIVGLIIGMVFGGLAGLSDKSGKHNGF